MTKDFPQHEQEFHLILTKYRQLTRLGKADEAFKLMDEHVKKQNGAAQ